MANGWRSLFGPLGGASRTRNGGFRSLLGFWSGGANWESQKQGFRSFLAFWAGGGGLYTAPTPTPVPVGGGGGGGGGWQEEEHRRRRRQRTSQDDRDMFDICSLFVGGAE